MSKALEVTYDVAEVDGLTEARATVSRLELDVVYCHPAWRKLNHVKEYLQKRQYEAIADALTDPEAA